MSMKSVFDQGAAIDSIAQAKGGLPVSLQSALPAPSLAATLDLFHFISRGKVAHNLRVVHFQGEERVNQTYDLDIELVAPQNIDPLTTLEEALLGHPGTLVMMEAGDVPRVVHGVVTGYEVLGSLDRDSVRIQLKLSPRLSLLKMRVHSRIFQNETIPAIVDKILTEW